MSLQTASVRARESRHLAQRGAGERQRRVVIRRRLGDAEHEEVRQRVRDVARQREEAVVGGGVRPNRARTERGDEALHERDALGRGCFGRSQEPGRLVEQVGRGARGAAGGSAGDGMARNEAGILDRRERTLGRGDVGHHDAWPGGVQHLPHDGRSRADRNRDDHELRVPDRLRERLRRLDRAARRRALEHAGVRVEAAGAGARAAGGEGDRRADEAGADDGEALNRTWPLGRSLGRRRRAALGRDLLLQHIEDGGEDRRDAAFRQRPGVGRDELLQQLRLALGIDPALAGRVLVVADGGHELEPPVQQLE